MKLLIITAISAFDSEVKQILKKAKVKTFTYKEAKGHKDVTEEAIENNWFAAETIETDSILYYAFVQKEHAVKVFDEADYFNESQETTSHIHVAVLNVEKSNYNV